MYRGFSGASALEDNLGFFRVVNGSRPTIAWAEPAPTSTNQWHTLSLALTSSTMSVRLEGTTCLTHSLPGPVMGRIALWSKEDSVVLFDDLVITPASP